MYFVLQLLFRHCYKPLGACESGMGEDMQRAVLMLAFIILIYLAVVFGADYPVTITGLVAVCGLIFMGCLFGRTQREHLTENAGSEVSTSTLSDSEVSQLDDDRFYGKYQNVDMTDLDSMLQRPYDINLGKNPGPGDGTGMGAGSDVIDNSAAVAEAISRGNTVFQPSMQGVSVTSSAMISNFNLAEPGPIPDFAIPLNNRATSVDESLARKMQHRGAMNKKAIDGAVRTTKNKFAQIFRNELDENESQDWWSAQAVDIETDFLPPY